nr:hypothetical protein KK1_000701 [Cajanus cajan]
MKYFGPFEVVSRIGTVAYKLKLPDAAKIHPIFHISLLKKFFGNSPQPYVPLPITTNELGPIVQPWKVLAYRTILRQSRQVPQVLIQCERSELQEAVWEDVDIMKESYPHFNLEDKVAFDGESIVTWSQNDVEEMKKFVM